jgi:hypothetical protein
MCFRARIVQEEREACVGVVRGLSQDEVPLRKQGHGACLPRGRCMQGPLLPQVPGQFLPVQLRVQEGAAALVQLQDLRAVFDWRMP